MKIFQAEYYPIGGDSSEEKVDRSLLYGVRVSSYSGCGVETVEE
jgi:hypothetical protein